MHYYYYYLNSENLIRSEMFVQRKFKGKDFKIIFVLHYPSNVSS